jgi:mono/diheme cytochrome c family protein
VKGAIAALITGVIASSAHADEAKTSAAANRAIGVSFDRDVQPIFSRACIRCHGATEKKGGLGLSDREAAFGELDSGLQAIVPGKPEESELLRRIASDDPSERMPASGEPLSADEISAIRRWIEQGAEWPQHWAYRPLVRPQLPDSAKLASVDWAQTPIDLFILQRLEQHGLAPSPPADKRAWLRRVSFDLIGLPPTPEELAAFLEDESPEAFERVVDRLLASPHYGERWARHWMDVVHYAETHGHDQDRPRPHAWPYRDYLIRAFNDDKPYARFVEEQVAGDALYPGDPWALVATGFLATGPWDESSLRDIREDSIDREIGRYLDRDDIVTTVISTFASATVHCARCHDHKFDPITQSDYYSLQAVFAATGKGNRAYDSDPEVATRRLELQERIAALPKLREQLDPSLLTHELRAEVAAWEEKAAAAASQWVVLQPEEFKSEHGAVLTKQPDGSLLSGGPRPESEVYTIIASTTLSRVTGIRLEVLTDPSLPMNGPGRQENGNLHLNEFTLTAAPGGDLSQATPVELANPKADFDQEGWTIGKAIDGNADSAWGVFPEVGKPHLAVFELKSPIENDGGAAFTFRLKQTHGRGHLIGRPRLSVTSAAAPLPLDAQALPGEVAAALSVPREQRDDAQRATLAAHYLQEKLAAELASLPPPQLVYCGSNEFQPDGAFKPAPGPRPIHVLHRGEISQPGEPAAPGALACIEGLDAHFAPADSSNDGQRRAALARWLSDARNVLTWRSIVNRLWHYHFGRGLSDTPNDFGRMGSPPTHPELLDWLAVELRESGGSLKHIQRLIVTSAVYRQASNAECGMRNAESTSSIPPSPLRIPHLVDSDNRLLWRMNRTRLDAESVRDAALLASGMLDRTMGGPSVKQFIESPGVHVTPNVDYRNFDVNDPANHRRSVYRFVFRTLPDPFLETLDCPDASQLTAKRTESVSALQALAMLNNPFMVRQSEHLAERLARERPDLPQQIDRLYELVLNRRPRESESAAFADYAQKHGLANACRLLLNSSEFMFVD